MPSSRILIVCAFLAFATLLAFWQVNHCDFINYDDNSYVTENSHVRNGLTVDGIRWAFTTSYTGNWHPLTWVSHMADVQVFGLNPHWHHLTNLLLHIANTLLLFLVLYRLTKAFWQSAFVAALFALHPLHVQSVAWVAERKDVLSTFFWMLTIGAYCYYAERPSLWRYLPIFTFLAIGLMAKPMLVTLPFVLLLVDYWPLGRFEQNDKSAKKMQTEPVNSTTAGKRKATSGKRKTSIKKKIDTKVRADSRYRPVSILSLLSEKVPLLVLTILSTVVTYIVQHEEGAVIPVERFPLAARVENAFISYIMYIGKMIWPNKLAVFYPYQGPSASWRVLGAVLFFTAVTLIVIRAAKKFRYLTVGWLWYVGTLVPVIGVVQVGAQARADRYTYIPLIGLFIMTAWGLPVLLGKWRYRKKVLTASATLALGCFFVVTRTQVGYWQNSFTLFGHALKVTDNNYIAYAGRGNAYFALGNHKEAIKDYDRAIEISPEFSEAHNNRGSVYLKLGNYRQAIADYDRAIEVNPGNQEAYYNRGTAYEALGYQEQAIADYDRVIEVNPRLASTYFRRGNAYASLGNYRQAIADYDRAIEVNPRFAEAYCNRGNAYGDLSNYRQAIVDCDRAIEVNPRFAEAYCNRGNAHRALGNHKQAIADYDRAIQINPKFALAYRNRAISYDSLGNKTQAYDDLKAAASLGDKPAQNVLRTQGISW